MYSFETKIRIRYGDTDKMGYAYYGNYPRFYEVGRTEMLRSLGYTYGRLEDQGIMMPVISLNINYFQPAYYDDELTIKTIVKELPLVKMRFEYEIRNTKGDLINQGETVLAFIDEITRKPMRAPKQIMERLEPFFIKE